MSLVKPGREFVLDDGQFREKGRAGYRSVLAQDGAHFVPYVMLSAQSIEELSLFEDAHELMDTREPFSWGDKKKERK